MAGEGRWMAPRRERGEEDAGKRKKERRGNLDILETLVVAVDWFFLHTKIRILD